MRTLLLLAYLLAAMAAQAQLRNPAFLARAQDVPGSGSGGGGGGGSAPTDPTAYWTMDEVGGGTRTDSVAGIALARTGSVPTVTGLIGNAASFTNVSGALTASYVAALAYTQDQDFSASYWIQFKTAYTGDAITQFEYWRAAGNGSFDVQAGGNTLYVSVDDDVFNYDDVQVPSFTFTQDQWYHYVLVYDGTTHLLSYYQDGALVGTTDTAVTVPTGATARVRFRSSIGVTSCWIDEASVWIGHKLSASEITYLYNSGSGRTCCPF
jgi:Concanavalin A-like lectin/glucanases superfamily